MRDFAMVGAKRSLYNQIIMGPKLEDFFILQKRYTSITIQLMKIDIRQGAFRRCTSTIGKHFSIVPHVLLWDAGTYMLESMDSEVINIIDVG